MVGNRHDHAVAGPPIPPGYGDVDSSLPSHRLRRVAQQIREGAAQGIVVGKEHRPPAVCVHRHLHTVRHSRATLLLEQLHQIHLAPRPFGQPAELGELPCQPVEPVGLRAQHLRRHGYLRLRPALE